MEGLERDGVGGWDRLNCDGVDRDRKEVFDAQASALQGRDKVFCLFSETESICELRLYFSSCDCIFSS